MPKESAAAKAGIQAGDIILSWSRAAAPPANPRPSRGTIETPFDIVGAEIEEAPRGVLTFVGTRAGRRTTWILSPGPPGLVTRPTLPEGLLALHREGASLVESKSVEEGVSRWRRAAAEGKKLGLGGTSLWLLSRAGKALAEAGRRPEADLAYAQAIRDAEDAGSTAIAAQLLNDWGETLYNRSEWDRAEDCLRRAMALDGKLGPERLAIGQSLHLLGAIAWKRGDLQKAEEYDEQALAIREKLAPGSLSVASSLNALGLLAQDRGDLPRAESYYRRALTIQQSLAPEGLYVANSLGNLGNLAWRRGELVTADELYRRALAIYEKLSPDGEHVANALNSLGLVARNRGELARAEEYHQRALAIWEKRSPGSLGAAVPLGNLGVVANERGDLATAEALHRRALAIKERLAPGSLTVSVSLNSLGVVAEHRGDLAAAEDYYRRCLTIRERLAPGTLGVAVCLLNLGGVAKTRGDSAKAEECYRQALTIQEKLAPESLDIVHSLSSLGSVAMERGDLASAEGHYQRSLSILEKVASGNIAVPENLRNLGLVAQRRGDLVAAEQYCQRSLAIAGTLAPESMLAAGSLSSLGDLAEDRGDRVAAMDYHRRALALREKLAPGSAAEAESLHALGRIHRHAGQLDAAAGYFLRAIQAFEGQRSKLGGTEEVRSGFAAKYASFFNDAMHALVELGRPADALQVRERSRARSFLALLTERDLLFAADLPADLARERKLTDAAYDRVQAALAKASPAKDAAEVEKLLGRLRELREKQEEVAAKARKASPRFASLQYPEPLDLAAVRNALDQGTTFLAYSVGARQTLLFVVRASPVPGSGLSVFSIPVSDEALREKVEAFRDTIQTQDRSGRERLLGQAAALYDLLVRPAASQIAGSDRLLISADGPLQSLPFGALVRRETQKRERLTSYLIEWKPIHIVQSATVYAELKKHRREASSAPGLLVAFGDPRYPSLSKDQVDRIANPEVRSVVTRGYGLDPLPATREEVEAIAALFPTVRTYLGEEATEERAKVSGQDARYVHFACHGFVDERFPLNSALALTIPEKPAEGQENGLLQAWEIFENVRLDADLVTLSACETGLGKEMGGEGLLGLTRAFHYAGARSVLASLWAVSDESTAVLMKRFYGYLKDGKSRDEALRAAQLDLIRTPAPPKGSASAGLSHPFHWAAFQLSGDWR